MLGTAAVLSRALLRLGSSRAFVCEGPDSVVRHFWWRRLEQGDYDVSHSISLYLPLVAYEALVSIALGTVSCRCWGIFLAVIRRSWTCAHRAISQA